jgi:transcriptional antiterminator RfaH
MPYWCAARAPAQREALAEHFLKQQGYAVYLPRLRQHRVNHGRKIETRPPLFPGYLFVWIVLQWHTARWCPGTLGLVMNCGVPVSVPDRVLEEIRKREVRGLVELPKAPRLKPGDPIRVRYGPLAGHVGLFDGMKAHERVAVLLRLLGGSQRVTLASDAVEAVP